MLKIVYLLVHIKIKLEQHAFLAYTPPPLKNYNFFSYGP